VLILRGLECSIAIAEQYREIVGIAGGVIGNYQVC
jgi:hypothetical protein